MSENDPFTPDLTEPLAVDRRDAALGVALVNVTMGNPYAQPHFGRPFEYPPPDGYESPEHPLVGVDRHFKVTEAIQRAYPDLPVVGTGYSYLQEFLPQVGAANVRDGRVTFVGVGRASLAQPDWVRQLLDHGKARPQARLPDVQLLHGPDAGEGPPARPVPDRLPAVRQGGVRRDVEGSARVECEGQI